MDFKEVWKWNGKAVIRATEDKLDIRYTEDVKEKG